MNSKGNVVFVDDEEHICRAAQQTLELAGYEVSCFQKADAALAYLKSVIPHLLISDVRMPDIDGLSLLQQTVKVDAELPVILITGHGDVAMAVQAMRQGAYDFIEKPFAADQLVEAANRALEKRNLVLDNRALRLKLKELGGLEAVVIGNSDAMILLRQVLLKIAGTNADVLIFGETGTGKELIARCLHEHSCRRGKRFVAVNCGAMPENIIESELFGHEAGAFTGANKQRIGKFEYADGGTFFLDEIESMPMALQVKLLRVLQERSIERLGGNRTIPLNVRILAATKCDLLALSQENVFREDLFYRLNVARIEIPPLRQRGEDIPLLFQYFLKKSCMRYGRDVPFLQPDYLQSLAEYSWPGNVRELQNVCDRVALGLDEMNHEHGPDQNQYPETGPGLSIQVEAYEKSLLVRELCNQQGNLKAVCDALCLPRKTLYDKMKKYGLSRSDFIHPDR